MRIRRVLFLISLILLLTLGTIGPAARGAAAQQPNGHENHALSVEILLPRIFSTDAKDPYELTADFTGSLTLAIRNSRWTVNATGVFDEWRTLDGTKHRKVEIHRLDVPALLRPFSGWLKRTIEERIQTQAERPEAFYAHDVFVLEERHDGRYVLVGVRRDLVDETLDHYGASIQKTDPDVRRKIAQWLYTSPTGRSRIVRPGPPYAFLAVVDEEGLIYELASSYDWGEVEGMFTYTSAGGEPVWRQISAKFIYMPTGSQSNWTQVTDTVRELTENEIEGQIKITFANHCLNCRHP